LSTRLSDLDAGVLKAVVPDISALQERAIPDAPAMSEGYQERLIATLSALFRRHHNTVLLVLEDLQWASESLEPLRQILKIRDQLPGLFVLGTYRDDEKPDLPDQLPGMEVLSMRRLSDSAISELSVSMLGESGRRPEVVELITRETEGNAYFIVEVVRALAEDSGRLSDVGNRTLPETVLAGGVQQVLQRRLNRLPEDVRMWLRPVAVAGRELDLPVVEQFGIAGAALETYLACCADVAVLELADGNWRFNHDKLRERLLLDLIDEEKPVLHRQVAEAIESVHSDHAGFSEVLYDHWRRAEDLDKEIHYLDLVARRLIEIYNATDQARTLLESGLNKLSQSDPRRINLLDLHFKTYSLLHKSEMDAARSSAQEAFALAQRFDDRTGIAISLKNQGIAASNQEAFDQAEHFFQQSLELSQSLDDSLLTLDILKEFGQLNWNCRRFEQSRLYYEQCYALSQSLRNQSFMARSLTGLGHAAYMLEAMAEAKTYYEQALALYQTIGYKANIVRMLGLLGLVTTNEGEYEQAQAYHEQAIALSQEIGDRFNAALGTINLASTLSTKGDYPQCRMYFERALAICREIDNQYLVGFTLDALTTSMYRQGAYTEAIPYAEEALALYRTAEGWQTNMNVAAMLYLLGAIYLKAGDGRARQTFHQALHVAHAHGMADSLLDSLFGFVLLYAAAGQIEKAVELISLLQIQPTFGHKVQGFLDIHLPDFKPDLSSETLQAAATRGESLDLKAVIEQLLEEFAE
jgi:predicted ATPase